NDTEMLGGYTFEIIADFVPKHLSSRVCGHSKGEGEFWCLSICLKRHLHKTCHMMHHIHDYRVTKLLVGPGIRDRNVERFRKAHETRAFTRSKSSRVLLLTLAN